MADLRNLGEIMMDERWGRADKSKPPKAAEPEDGFYDLAAKGTNNLATNFVTFSTDVSKIGPSGEVSWVVPGVEKSVVTLAKWPITSIPERYALQQARLDKPLFKSQKRSAIQR